MSVQEEEAIDSEGEAIEVQLQAGGDHNCVFVFPKTNIDGNKINLNLLVKSVTRPVDESKINLPVKSVVDNDESTAKTEASTDVDENSLRERFSFGSLSLSDTGTFQSHDNAVHAPQPWRVRSKRDNLFSIGEANGSLNDQNHKFQKNSLFDLDLDDDDLSRNAIDKSFGIKLASGNPADSSEVDASTDESVEIFHDKYRLYSDSRAEFYRGYSLGNFVGDKLHSCERSASSKSMFPTGTLNTDSRIGFYRVSSSVYEEPLSCQEKFDQVSDTLRLDLLNHFLSIDKFLATSQPALSCDEGFWDPNRSTESAQGKVKQNGENIPEEERGNVSVFKDKRGVFSSALTCCFMPPID